MESTNVYFTDNYGCIIFVGMPGQIRLLRVRITLTLSLALLLP